MEFLVGVAPTGEFSEVKVEGLMIPYLELYKTTQFLNGCYFW